MDGRIEVDLEELNIACMITLVALIQIFTMTRALKTFSQCIDEHIDLFSGTRDQYTPLLRILNPFGIHTLMKNSSSIFDFRYVLH